MKNSIGGKLKSLRNLFGYKLEYVSEKTGIVKSSISAFETNKREPSIAQLQIFAKLYQKSISFFFVDEIARPAMLWREEPESDSEKINIEEKFYKYCKQYFNLEIWSNNSKKDNFNKLIKIFPSNYKQVEVIADDVWKLLGIGDKPGSKLFSILEEEYSIKIFHEDFNGSAISYYDDTIGPAIMLNMNNKQWRRNYDLAHELFHLITWKNRENIEKEEKFANCFASELLMPRESIIRSVENELSQDRKLTSCAIDTLARQYEVSYEALLFRIYKLYNLTNIDKVAIKKISDSIKNDFIPRENNIPSKFPKRYETLAICCLRDGEISMAQCAKYLEKPVSLLANLNLLAENMNNEIKIPIDTM